MVQQAVSTELTGGAGFTYEDTIVAYYLAALLREERAAPLGGIVKTVAVQQAGHGDPMDDIIVEVDDDGSHRKLSLQGKRKITISAASSNIDFRDILSRAVATRTAPGFQDEIDAYGFVGEYIAVDSLRTLQRIIDWAKSSPTGAHFAAYFAEGGSAAKPARMMRKELAPLIGAKSENDERQFYAQFVAVKLDGLMEGGARHTEFVDRLQELVAVNEDGQGLILFDRLCGIARQGAGTARKWTRHTLLAQLRGTVRLKVAPNYKHDLDLLRAFSAAGLADISEHIDGFRVERPLVEQNIRERLAQARLVNISGLPGCGKSAMLRRIASVDAASGPILLLKSDRLEGKSWLTFANALGLKHHTIVDLLAEIGATGTAILL